MGDDAPPSADGRLENVESVLVGISHSLSRLAKVESLLSLVSEQVAAIAVATCATDLKTFKSTASMIDEARVTELPSMATSLRARSTSLGQSRSSRAPKEAAGEVPFSEAAVEGDRCKQMFSQPSSRFGLRMHSALENLGKADDIRFTEEDVTYMQDLVFRSDTKSARMMSRIFEVDNRGHRFVLDPYSKRRVLYDLVFVLVLVIELMGIPVVLAWDIPMEGWLRAAANAAIGFWTLDVVLSFWTGYYHKGKLECRLSMIAKRYIRSWFFPDLLVLSIDMLSAVLAMQDSTNSVSGAALFRLSKSSRFLRLVRLVRLVKLSEIASRVSERNHLGGFDMVMETMRPLLVILMVNHMMACAWYAVGKYATSDTGFSWLAEPMSGGGTADFGQASMAYQYTTALHWAMTQMTPGSMQVFPQNTSERIYNFFCLLLGMVVFSSIISSLSAKLNQYQMKEKEKALRLIELRRFLRMKAVHPATHVAVMKHAEEALSFRGAKPRTMSDVTGIGLLSESMRKRLRFELLNPHLTHPLLRWWAVYDTTGFEAFCHDDEATSFTALAPRDNLFLPRQVAAGAYVHMKGSLRYIMHGNMDSMEFHQVPNGSTLSELALWTDWVHSGEVLADEGSELIFIKTEGMANVLKGQKVVRNIFVAYAKSIVSCLNDRDDPENGVSDLSTPKAAAFDVVLQSLPHNCRQIVSVVSIVKAKRRLKKAQLNKCAEDIRSGKMLLTINAAGEAERMVSLLLLRLLREDGKVLVELGEVTEAGVHVDPKLPGKKQQFDELTHHVYAKLLNGPLAVIRDSIQVMCRSVEIKEEFSHRADFATKYTSTIYHAEFLYQSRERFVSELSLGCVDPVEATQPSHTMRLSVRRFSSLESGMAGDNLIEAFLLADGEGHFFVYGWVSADFFENGRSAIRDTVSRAFVSRSIPDDLKTEAIARYRAAVNDPSAEASEQPVVAEHSV